MKFNGDGPIVALDIDGTLADYHGWFLPFAELFCGKPMPDAKDINPGLPLHKHMGISKATYRECKLAFRQGGMKRSMPCYEGASELTRAIRKAGAEVWITTTRPYLRYDRIDKDTRIWMRRNGIQYDAVLYGEHKYRDLVRNVGASRVVAVLDDLPEMVMQATALGVDGIIRDQPYNKHFSWHLRADDLADAQRWILKRLEQWKIQHG